MKNVKIIAIIIAMLLGLTSCGRKQELENYEEMTTNTTTEVTSEITEVIEEVTLAKKEGNISTKVGTEKYITFQLERERLEPKLQKLYDTLKSKILKYENFKVEINQEITLDEFYKVTSAITDDFPQCWLYFNTTEEDIIFSNDGEQIGCRSVVSSYSENWREVEEVDYFKADDVETLIEECNRICDKIISTIPEGATEEEKYELLAKAICAQTEYVDNSENKNYLYMSGPLLNGIGICQGYAQAYQYLCHRAGLCCYIQNSTKICHAWNAIMIDGNIYHCDITWYDNEGNETWLKFGQNEAKISHCPDDGQIIAIEK